jgi:hypothetical protein
MKKTVTNNSLTPNPKPFALFEAAVGWCAARACGIKTRI